MIDKINYLLVLAATKPKITAGQAGLPDTDSNAVFNNLVDLLYWGAGITAVFVIIIAGIIFATSEGEAEKITRARKMVQYSVVGIVVVLIAATLIQLVIGRF